MTWKNISDIIKLPIKALNEGKFEQVKKNICCFHQVTTKILLNGRNILVSV